MYAPLENDTEKYTLAQLDRELDKIKAHVFLGKYAAFLGTLMCNLNFQWSEQVPTAGTNGTNLYFNPDFFMKIPVETRKAVLMHELWHVARLHPLRTGSRNPKVFNWACDIRINNDLENEGFTFEGTKPWLNQNYGEMAEEDIYDDLMKRFPQGPMKGPWDGQVDDLDLLPSEKAENAGILSAVVRAVHQANISGGSIPGDIKSVVDKFLTHVVPWETLLYKFFSDLAEEDWSWRKPDRRHQEIYLPSRFEDEGRLAHLIYYLDVSGSITDEDIIRFNSEVKYIKETFNPQKLTVVQFDTRITDEVVWDEKDVFNRIEIIGRGGTYWSPVKAHIEENEPTAVVIFTDMGFADPITPLKFDIPVMWVCNYAYGKAPFGELIHIKG